MRAVKIGTHDVGLAGQPVYIIAEIGANHDGDLTKAKRMIQVAADAGADAAKFQLYRANRLYLPSAGYADYLGDKTSIVDIIKENEMPEVWLGTLSDYCRDWGVDFLCTAFDEELTDLVAAVRPPAFKIASYELNHLPLIRHTASKKKPIIISTGAGTMGEIQDALETCRAAGNQKTILMHCVAKYPAPIEDLNLACIATLQNAFGVPTGWSDHSENPVLAPQVAAAAGAVCIEKHFTLDKTSSGPDHAFAIEPDGLAAMIKAVRQTESFSVSERNAFLQKPGSIQALGSPVKAVTPSELELFAFAKRSIYTNAPVPKGQRLSAKNVAILRSGKNPAGLAPKFWDTILGAKVVCDIPRYAPITWEVLLSR